MESYRAELLFADFFRDLAVAGRAISGYPAGHPAVAGGLTRAQQALTSLLAETGPIELAAARDAILWTDQRFVSPPAVHLAKLLRRRRAAGVLLEPGATAGELETFLRALAVDTRAARDAGSLAAELSAAGLVRVRVSDLDFSSLALVDGEDDPAAPEAGAFAARVLRRLLANGTVPAELAARWTRSQRTASELLQLLLEGGGTGDVGGELGPGARGATAQAIAAELGDPADPRDRAAVAEIQGRLRGDARGLLLRALARATAPAPTVDGPPGSGEEGPRIQPRQLATLRRVFATADVDAFRDTGTPAEELVALLELPEDPAGLVLSPGSRRIAGALDGHAPDGEAVSALLGLAEREEVPPAALANVLRRFERGVLRMLAAGAVRQVIPLHERAGRQAGGAGPSAPPFRATVERLSGAEAIDALAASLPDLPDDSFEQVPGLVDRMGPGAVRHLLDVLARTENRRTRFRLLDLLARLGPVVARDASALLGDARWYVVRNMLLLLRRVGDVRSVTAIRRCVDHPDLRVRLEAIHTLFTFDKDVPRGLLRKALHHPDPRQAEAAMELAGKFGIAEAVDPMVEYLRSWDPFGKRRAARLKAIRALAAIGDPRALAGLGRFRTRVPLLAPAVEERRELYRTLPAYPEESYQEWIRTGLRSGDPEVRRLSAAMGPVPGAGP